MDVFTVSSGSLSLLRFTSPGMRRLNHGPTLSLLRRSQVHIRVCCAFAGGQSPAKRCQHTAGQCSTVLPWRHRSRRGLAVTGGPGTGKCRSLEEARYTAPQSSSLVEKKGGDSNHMQSFYNNKKKLTTCNCSVGSSSIQNFTPD
jgi:hypothetical protein